MWAREERSSWLVASLTRETLCSSCLGSIFFRARAKKISLDRFTGADWLTNK